MVGIVVIEMDVAELAPKAKPATSDVEMVLANVSLTATINTAVMMVAEEPVELVKMEPSVKDLLMLILDNATSTV